ncbi:MAG: outer membrane beta-barrel protein [Bacteroides sp.]|nr:outer membrane beta-barrel protein [Bacteroides sp.]MCM1085125.1 outer membrane beta-barrel protein [Bacteroides sp.]
MLKSAGDEKLHFGLSIGGACNTTFPVSGPWRFDAKETKIGFTGGAFFELDFAKRFFAHFEVNISGRRLLANGISADTALGNFDLSYHYTNINVPLGLGVSFFPASNPFNVSFIACAVVGFPQYNKSQINVSRQDVEKQLQVVNVGGLAELRLKYEFAFLAFRYEFSGMNLFKYRQQAFKTGTFSFMLGFQII